MRRRKVYLSDWTDGFKNLKKVIPAILFLYFACLSPAISFGTIASQLTYNSMGVVEFLLSAGTSGMVSQVDWTLGKDVNRSNRVLFQNRPTRFSVVSQWRSSLPQD